MNISLIILQWVINALSIVVAVNIIDGITFRGIWWHMIIIGALFGLINSLIRPVIKFFMYPIILLTLGLFTLVINAAMFGLTAIVSRSIDLGLTIDGFWPALWGALIISLVSTFLSWAVGLKGLKKKAGGGKHEK